MKTGGSIGGIEEDGIEAGCLLIAMSADRSLSLAATKVVPLLFRSLTSRSIGTQAKAFFGEDLGRQKRKKPRGMTPGLFFETLTGVAETRRVQGQLPGAGESSTIPIFEAPRPFPFRRDRALMRPCSSPDTRIRSVS